MYIADKYSTKAKIILISFIILAPHILAYISLFDRLFIRSFLPWQSYTIAAIYDTISFIIAVVGVMLISYTYKENIDYSVNTIAIPLLVLFYPLHIMLFYILGSVV